MVQSSRPPNPFDPVEFQSYDYIIGGKLVVGKATLSEEYSYLMKVDMDAKDRLKHHMVQQLVEYILNNKLCEFTQMDDPLSGDKRVMVRAYMAPDDQVKILRMANKIV